MTKTDDKDQKKTLGLSKQIDLKKSVGSGQVRQSFSHGRSKSVTVEVKRKRVLGPQEKPVDKAQEKVDELREKLAARGLSEAELDARLRAVRDAAKTDDDFVHEGVVQEEDALVEQVQEEAPLAPLVEVVIPAVESVQPVVEKKGEPAKAHPFAKDRKADDEDEEDDFKGRKTAKVEVKKAVFVQKKDADRRRSGKISVNQVFDEDGEGSGGQRRGRSLASIKRAREKERQRQMLLENPPPKFSRDIIIPDYISVQELANRMAERGADVVKSLMGMGMMVTITQTIDGDTAELIVNEFGHKPKRVSESDVEVGLSEATDHDDDLRPRAPVVTVMGHVDHGKTSLLDALRQTDVVAGEAGGITQHIGAYQVTMKSGQKLTFIDTPGHAAFTEMRARGANVTDVVVLVVAADDGIMEQTIEAIRHAKAAGVPIVVAVNKIDKPDANPSRVYTELLNHELVVESLGGDILAIEVSAKAKINLEKLEEAILLQSEILDLRANPNSLARGVVIEAKIEKGRGNVATVLVQKGTLNVGDIFVAGPEWGRVRALINDHGKRVEKAGPSDPVEVLGLNGAPSAGDDFTVVETEAQARSIAEFRQRKIKDSKAAAATKNMMEQMFARSPESGLKELSVIIKADVQGSIEAISSSIEKLSTDEVRVRVLHSAVGAINESDITLAKASQAFVIGFNVRANPQARDLAKRDLIELRYYSIIYNVIEDVRAFMSGMLSPDLHERFLGYASIREVFSVTKVGKIAGCMITEGVVKRGSKVRLLRDNVVIHEGSLKTLKRFKDEVREVREGYECGMAFENYQDIQQGDVIECFDIEAVAREL